jgi:hypothetical protein
MTSDPNTMQIASGELVFSPTSSQQSVELSLGRPFDR